MSDCVHVYKWNKRQAKTKEPTRRAVVAWVARRDIHYKKLISRVYKRGTDDKRDNWKQTKIPVSDAIKKQGLKINVACVGSQTEQTD